MSNARLIDNAAEVRAAARLLRAAGVSSVPKALVAVGFGTTFAVASAVRSGMPAVRSPVWWVLVAASGVATLTMWVAITMPRHRITGQIVLCVALAALAVVMAVTDVDPKHVFNLIEAML
ncbi:uncharacterized protein LOC133905929 [Phragmites australis]|uniref:uncharacterized protein LOC133905929 n=1 Tax=Phragmites australis TaxID=29695 RepID=UPI002D78595F|nr:uncharacterized protein LOC133905929 [Phragmites australis]